MNYGLHNFDEYLRVLVGSLHIAEDNYISQTRKAYAYIHMFTY